MGPWFYASCFSSRKPVKESHQKCGKAKGCVFSSCISAFSWAYGVLRKTPMWQGSKKKKEYDMQGIDIEEKPCQSPTISLAWKSALWIQIGWGVKKKKKNSSARHGWKRQGESVQNVTLCEIVSPWILILFLPHSKGIYVIKCERMLAKSYALRPS